MKINIRQILKKLPYIIGAVAILLSGILHYYMHRKDLAIASLAFGLLLILSYLLRSTVFNKQWRHARDIRVTNRRAARSMRIPRKPWFERSGWFWNWNWSGFFKATGISKIFFWQWRWKAFFTKVGNYTIFNPSRWRKSVVLKSIVVALAIAAAFVVEKHWANTTYAVGAFVLVILGTTVIYYAVYYMAVFVKYVAKNYASWQAQTRQNIQNMSKKTVNRLVILGLATVSALAAYWYGGSKYAIGVFVSIILLAIILSFGSKIASYLSNMFRGNTNNQNNGNNNSQTNVDDAELGCLEFPNNKCRENYEFAVTIELWVLPILIMVGALILSFMASFWFLLIGIVASFVSYFWYESLMVTENPQDEILLMTIIGKPVAFARRGGGYIKPLYLAKTKSETNKLIVIGFGKEFVSRAGSSASGEELSISCASRIIAEAFKDQFVETYEKATYKAVNLTGEEAYKKAVKDDLNNAQLLFKSELNTSLKIDVFPTMMVTVNNNGTIELQEVDDSVAAFNNVVNYFSNIPGETRKEREDFFRDQLRENLRSQLNTQYKRYTYSMLTILMTTDALDETVRKQIESMIDKQQWGLTLISSKLTALGAPSSIHDDQINLAKAEFTATTGIIKAKGEKEASLEKSRGEAESIKIKAAADQIRIIAEGKGASEAFKLLGVQEVAILKSTLKMIKLQFPNDLEMTKEIARLEYRLEEQKILPQIKGPVIIKSNGGGSDGNDNTVQTVLLKQAIDSLAEIIKNKA